MKNENKKKVGRPNKMPFWLKALSEVLENPESVFLSDKDLIIMVNLQIPDENHRISKSAYEKWKAGKFAPDEECGKEFLEHIEMALIRQKLMLGKKLFADDTKQWSKIKWIIETKFSEWRKVSEKINRNENNTTINITAGNDEQRKLIESLINTDFIEIKPIPLPEKIEVKPLTDNEKEDEFEF